MNNASGYPNQNPKDAIGSTKVPMSLVPATFIAETALAFLEGKEKYGQVNWRAAPIRASVYIDAAYRHLSKFSECQERDPETGVHHLGNAGACLGILIDAAAHGTLVDDRNYTRHNMVASYIDNLCSKVKHIQNLFRDKNPKDWTKADMADMKGDSNEKVNQMVGMNSKPEVSYGTGQPQGESGKVNERKITCFHNLNDVGVCTYCGYVEPL